MNANLDRMKYVGVVALLAECSHKADADMRDRIERALIDACEDGRMRYFKTITGGFRIEVVTGGQS